MRFRDAYIANDAVATAFMAPDFLSASGRAAATNAARGPLPEAVRSVLRRMNPAESASDRRTQSLDALDRDDLAVVITGQQVGLFGGPLYAVHKAAAAIRMARQLTEETGAPVVPIFWLQTEDHDAEEVCALTLTTRGGRVSKARAATDANDACPRTSMAHRLVPDDIQTALDAVDVACAELPHGDAVFALLEEHWTPGRSWVDAFAATLAALFADTGLLMFSPRSPEIAALAAPIHQWAIDEHKTIAQTLATRDRALCEAGFGSQVPVRENCSLSFVHPDDAGSARFRLRQCGDVWEGAGHGGPISRDQLGEWLATDPMRFSTSALLRPLVQDTLFPTAAYVGGPSEVDYFAQIEALYCLRGQRRPMVVPRPAWRWVPDFVNETLTRFDLTPSDLDDGVDAALERLGCTHLPGPNADEIRAQVFEAFEAALNTTCAALVDAVPATEGTTKRAHKKTRKMVGKNLDKFARRLHKARVRADEDRTHALTQAAAWLAPNAHHAERSLGFPTFAALVGIECFMSGVLDHADPLSPPPPHLPL